MQIKMLKAHHHLTSTEKKVIKAMIKANAFYLRSGRKTYNLERLDGDNNWAVYVAEMQTNSMGKLANVIHRSEFLVRGLI